MGAKLAVLGLRSDVLGFLHNWLEERCSKVVQGGSCSETVPLQDSVYQGTVLGSPLWNVFYADSREPLQRCGYTETNFADDLNCWKAFAKVVPPAGAYGPLPGHGPVLADLRGVQRELHLWGAANRVTFDPAKESFHILHRTLHHGETFKVLGCVFESQLLMHAAARHVAIEV